MLFDICRQISSDNSQYDETYYFNEDCFKKAQNTYAMLMQVDAAAAKDVKCIMLTNQTYNYNDAEAMKEFHAEKLLRERSAAAGAKGRRRAGGWRAGGLRKALGSLIQPQEKPVEFIDFDSENNHGNIFKEEYVSQEAPVFDLNGNYIKKIQSRKDRLHLGDYRNEFLQQTYAKGEIAAQVPQRDIAGEIVGINSKYFTI